MTLPDSADLAFAARALVRQAIDGHDDMYGFGSMSAAVYDTAWVSMITKSSSDHGRQWLFPQCFHYILRTQLEDGTWGPKASQVDVILNTAASLLSLQSHFKEALQMQEISQQELQGRIAKARAALLAALSEWDVLSSTHVGFEIILPAMLDRLEGEGFAFDFPGKHELRRINASKMAGFKPEVLYGRHGTAMIHSLEAFVGKVDFDRVSHHKFNGSMMASPSATAAYLMNASQWDDEAEAYLRYVVGRNGGADGVPSAYPSTYFEYTWLLSTFLKSGFTAIDLESPSFERMKAILTDAFHSGAGKIGFAPGLEADADDTAKGLLSLSLLRGDQGSGIDLNAMMSHFETETHFQTYRKERDPSFTTNCNVLSALVHEHEPTRYMPQIAKIVQFLCTYWWNTEDTVQDKWNLSHLYPTMLLVEALTELQNSKDYNLLYESFSNDTKAKIPITLFQACFRTLLSQQDDGSWSGSVEQTSYGILILSRVRRLSFLQDLQERLSSSIDSAAHFISTPASSGSVLFDYLWVEKVSYGSALLTEIYRIAALKSVVSYAHDHNKPIQPETFMASPGDYALKKKMMHSYVKLFRQTPLFMATPEWQLRSSFLEATLFQGLLRAQRLATFPRINMEEDKYFDMIPFTWTACNNRDRVWASSRFLLEMMKISFLNYQADEHMEAVAGPCFSTDLDQLRSLIDGICRSSSSSSSPDQDQDQNGMAMTNGKLKGSQNGHSLTEQQSQAIEPLERFVRQILHSPQIATASKTDRRILSTELRVFLQAHVTQHADNLRFRRQQQDGDASLLLDVEWQHPTDTFFHWVRTTSADHTSCPYSFAYVSCLLSSLSSSAAAAAADDCFTSAAQKYHAQAVCRHLSTMCRMYNDYGSVRRDAAERNLNSVNFPEFAVARGAGGGGGGLDGAKAQLFRLAEFERECLEKSMAALERELLSSSSRGNVRKLDIFRMFCDVTDLYGQIYVVKDMSSVRVNGGRNVASP